MPEATTTHGRVNIALTGKADIARDEIHEHFSFKHQQEIIRLGLAYALRLGLEPVRGTDFGRAGDGQNMNVGSFDPNRDLIEIVRAFHPESEEDPAALAETLMSLGLVKLAEDLKNSEVTRITDILYSDGESD